MRPTWLIETGVYGDEVTPLLKEIRRQGIAVEMAPYRVLAGSTSLISSSLPPDACVIGYGSFPFAREILLHRSWTPGAWCSAENLDCTAYFAFFGSHLLNQPHEILAGIEAVRQADRLYQVFGRDGRVFARPTSCHKIFVGRCIEGEAFATALAPTRYDPSTLVVIAAPRTIGREWRLVVVGDRVITGSQYAVGGERRITPDCPAPVINFAESMLRTVAWRPDPAFMLDVCESDGQLRLVELNSFSGSWLYACDLASVVAAASDQAERFWEERRA